jgi:hypothetical protein
MLIRVFTPLTRNYLIITIMLKPTSELLNAGDTAPEFELPTVERHTIRLADYRGKPLAVIFIRGTW